MISYYLLSYVVTYRFHSKSGYRNSELSYLGKRKYLDAICVFLWACTPVFISLITFALYFWLNGSLDARTVFTSVALLAMLIGPLNAFPWVLNGLVEAWVSLKRVQELIQVNIFEP